MKRKHGRRTWRKIKQADVMQVRRLAAHVLPMQAAQEATTATIKQKPNVEIHSDTKELLKEITKKQRISKTILINNFHPIRTRYLRNRATRINRKRMKTDRNNPDMNAPNKIPSQTPTTPGMKYGHTITIATLNCRGLAELSKRQQLTYIMEKFNIDILAMQETKQRTNSQEYCDGYTFFFSSSQNSRTQAGQGGRRPHIEHHGTGFIVSPKIKPFVYDCTPISDRIMELKIAAKGRNYTILNGYAPHSGRPLVEKQNFWNQIENHRGIQTPSSPVFIVGDFNARLHARQISELDIMGPHTFGLGSGFLQNMPPDQVENRQFLVDFCKYHDYVLSSTFFMKHPRKQCTFKFSTTNGFGPPWTPERFAQLDHIVCPRRWRNSILNVESRTDIAFDSDHAILTANLRIKLGTEPQISKRKIERYRTPDDSQKGSFNNSIRSMFRYAASQGSVHKNNSNFSNAIKHAARNALTKIPPEQKHTYISAEAWNAIQSRQQARTQGNIALEQQLNDQIKRLVKRDKKRWKLDLFEDLSTAKGKWKGIKIEKSTFKPCFYKMQDIHGQPVPLEKKADALAEYLDTKHWAPIDRQPPPKDCLGHVIDTPPPIEIGSITAEEVSEAIRASTPNKAPGPDGVVIELYKFLDDDNVNTFARILNQMWTEQTYPTDFTCAEVVSIFKKGDAELPQNYRPISLLNSSYKILAKILQKRIADATDQFLSITQFGFRKSRSTAEPLFCVRRLQDLGESGHENIILIFLDWEKAFDKLNHSKLIETLERMKIDKKMIDNIQALYGNPMFRTVHNNRTSDWKKQNSGIRQGCPLSPYLFVIMMNVLFSDVRHRNNDPMHNKSLQRMNFQELLYADDTLIVAKNTKNAKELIRYIEEESAYYNMKLNRDKCVCITFNKNNQVTFADGEPIKNVDETIYLGTQITKKVDPKTEINRRISQTMPTLKKLDLFWKQARVPNKWKIQVFNAVCVTKLLYSLEALQPTEAAASKLDTFQLKGLRKILRMTTTYIDRANTNEEVFRRANAAMSDGHHGYIRPLSEVLQEKRKKLLGHIIRRPRDHPQHQTTFATRTLIPRTTERRRVGRPRAAWTYETMKDSWKTRNGDIPFDIENRTTRKTIEEWAINREEPFN